MKSGPPRAFGRAALIVSVLIVAVATLMPRADPHAPYFEWRLTSAPHKLLEAMLNVALFLPFGASLRWVGARLRSAVLLGFALSLAVEMLQWSGIPGRGGELQDLIANSAGAVIGWLLAAVLLRRTRSA